MANSIWTYQTLISAAIVNGGSGVTPGSYLVNGGTVLGLSVALNITVGTGGVVTGVTIAPLDQAASHGLYINLPAIRRLLVESNLLQADRAGRFLHAHPVRPVDRVRLVQPHRRRAGLARHHSLFAVQPEPDANYRHKLSAVAPRFFTIRHVG